MTKQSNVSVVKGGVSGYINVALELKESASGVQYLQTLLGRGKKKNSDEFLPAYSIVAYGNVAKLMVATIQKGDLIRVTEFGLSIQKDDNFKKHNIASSFSIVVEDFEKIVFEKQEAPQGKTMAQQERPAAQERTQTNQSALAGDSFEDDIPF